MYLLDMPYLFSHNPSEFKTRLISFQTSYRSQPFRVSPFLIVSALQYRPNGVLPAPACNGAAAVKNGNKKALLAKQFATEAAWRSALVLCGYEGEIGVVSSEEAER
jgi:hypothetical protein